MQCIGLKLKPFTGHGGLHMNEKNSRVGPKTLHKKPPKGQTKVIFQPHLNRIGQYKKRNIKFLFNHGQTGKRWNIFALVCGDDSNPDIRIANSVGIEIYETGYDF